MFRRILFGTDFSPASRPAFRRAVALARQFRGRLLVVHVMPSGWPLGAEGYVTPRMYDEMESAIRRSAQKQLDRLVARAKRAGVSARGLLLSGAPPGAIALTARKERSDVVIVGTHGRSGLERLLAGSVASRIVGTAPCPVLTVRPR
jgi:nucleotide-binding universal stress UspA family protein